MHPAIYQKRADLDALRQINRKALADTYARLGRERPVERVRFQVLTRGPSAYHIVDLVTNQIVGFRFKHTTAVALAKEFEARFAGIQVTLSGAVQ